MSIEAVINAFRLPPQALVAHRIPKKMLMENAATSASDKRLLNDTLDEWWWQAALKPGTVGIAAHGDVIELALVCAQLRPGASETQARRLMQLIHRAIPYPVLLIAQGHEPAPGGIVFSVAHKRASMGEAGKWVVAETADTHAFDPALPTAAEAAFLSSLALDQLPRGMLANLATLYQCYADRITALAVAQVTGRFATGTADGASTMESAAKAAAQRDALLERQRVLQQLAAARSTAAKARQMNRRVELNLQIQRLQGDLQQIESKLT